MKKLLPLLFALLLGSPDLRAQAPLVDSMRQQLNYIFAALDKSQVPTGFLSNYGAQLVPLAAYNGTLADSNRSTNAVWRQVYATLVLSRVYGASPLPRLDSVSARLARAARATPTTIPVVLQRVDYARLRPDAGTAGLVTIQNGQIRDVPGRSQSPYETKTAFVAGPARTTSPTGNVSFVFPANLHVQSGGGSLQAPAIDFADGRGYLPVALGQPIGASYCAAGTYRVKVRARYANPLSPYAMSATASDTGPTRAAAAPPATPSTTYESHFDLLVQRPGCGSARYADPIAQVPFSPVAGRHSGGTVLIRYGGNHTQLVKPLIIAEGYDIHFYAPELSDNIEMTDFLEWLNVTDNNFSFINELDWTAQYDLVYLDYTKGTDDIRRNAALFEDVVRWVNNTKQVNQATGLREQNVVLGISMGGLVARYGLANMVKNPTTPNPNNDPDTRLLITQDSPHRGANVPLGIQALVRQSYEAMDLVLSPGAGLVVQAVAPQLYQANGLIDQPASQQLLIYRATNSTGGTSYNTFLDGDYRTMVTFPVGGPQPGYRFIANSLGSECATPLFAPGAELMKVDGGWFNSVFLGGAGMRAKADIFALPNNASSQRIAALRLYAQQEVFWVLHVTATIYRRSADCPINLLALDGAAGGTFRFGVSFPFQTNFSQTNWFSGGANLTVRAVDRFCFVPVASGLDVADFNSATLVSRYAGGVAQNSFSRAATFMTQAPEGTRANYPHPFFLGRQAHWLYNEMENLTAGQPLNCPASCAVPLAITGTSMTCGAAAFYAPTITGATYSWTTSPAGAFSPASGSGSSFYPGATGSGTTNAQVNLTISSPCINTTLTKAVTLCPPLGVSLSNGVLTTQCTKTSTNGNGQQFANWASWTAQGTGGSNYYQYTWYKDGNLSTVMKQESSAGPSTYGFCLGGGTYGQVTVRVTDATGGPVSASGSVQQYNRSAALYPNPARESVDVATPDASPAQPVTVRLYDARGTLRREQHSTAAAGLHLPTEKLPTGLYYVHLLRGQQVLSREQLRIEH